MENNERSLAGHEIISWSLMRGLSWVCYWWNLGSGQLQKTTRTLKRGNRSGRLLSEYQQAFLQVSRSYSRRPCSQTHNRKFQQYWSSNSTIHRRLCRNMELDGERRGYEPPSILQRFMLKEAAYNGPVWHLYLGGRAHSKQWLDLIDQYPGSLVPFRQVFSELTTRRKLPPTSICIPTNPEASAGMLLTVPPPKSERKFAPVDMIEASIGQSWRRTRNDGLAASPLQLWRLSESLDLWACRI